MISIISLNSFEVMWPIGNDKFKGLILTSNDDYVVVDSIRQLHNRHNSHQNMSLKLLLFSLLLAFIISFFNATWYNWKMGCPNKEYVLNLFSSITYVCPTIFDVSFN